MEDNKTNLKDLSKEEKHKLLEELTLNGDVFEAHARIAEARARIAKASLEEMACAVQSYRLQNPPESKENGTANDTEKS